MTYINKLQFLLFFLATQVAGCSARTDDERASTFMHLSKAVQLNNEANIFTGNFSSYESIPEDAHEKLRIIWLSSIEEAKHVNIIILNKEEFGSGDYFNKYFIGGLELCIKSRDLASYTQCQTMLNEYSNLLDLLKERDLAVKSMPKSDSPEMFATYSECIGFSKWLESFSERKNIFTPDYHAHIRNNLRKAAEVVRGTNPETEIDKLSNAASDRLNALYSGQTYDAFDDEISRCMAANKKASELAE